MLKRLGIVALIFSLLAGTVVFSESEDRTIAPTGVVESFEDGAWAEQPMNVWLSQSASAAVGDWTLGKGSSTTGFQLVSDPYNYGGKGLQVSGGSAISATKVFAPVAVKRTSVQFRITTPQLYDGRGHYMSIHSSDGKRLAGFGSGYVQQAGGIDGLNWAGQPMKLGQFSSSFGLLFASDGIPNGLRVEDLTNGTSAAVPGRTPYLPLEVYNSRYMHWQERYVRLEFDFATKTMDVYYADEPIEAPLSAPTVAGVPFADAAAADVGRITVGATSDSYKGMIYDEFQVKAEEVQAAISDALYTWDPIAKEASVCAQVRNGETGAAVVFAAAYAADKTLLGISDIISITDSMLYSDDFVLSEAPDMVKIFMWNSLEGMSPACDAATALLETIPDPTPSPTSSPMPSFTPGDVVFYDDFESEEWAKQPVETALNSEWTLDGSSYKRGPDTLIGSWTLGGYDLGGGDIRLIPDRFSGAAGSGLLFNMGGNPKAGLSGMTAKRTFAPTNGVVEFSYRFATSATDGNTGREHMLQLRDGDKQILSLGGGSSHALDSPLTVTDWVDRPFTVGSWGNYFGLYFEGKGPGDILNTMEAIDGRIPYVNLGSRTPNSFQYVKFRLDFHTKTIDVYWSSAPIDENTPVTVTVPFRDPTASAVDTLLIEGIYFARGDLYYDDFLLQKME